MITVTFACSGCDAVAEVQARAETVPIFKSQERFRREGGFVTVKKPSLEDLAPDGWVAFDPYTHITYCPKCWDSIENGEAQP